MSEGDEKVNLDDSQRCFGEQEFRRFDDPSVDANHPREHKGFGLRARAGSGVTFSDTYSDAVSFSEPDVVIPPEPSEADEDVVIDLREITTADAAGAAFDDTPSVMAIVVAEQETEHLYDVLNALADQTYDNLSVTVLNATGLVEVPERLQYACPLAEWILLPRGRFAESANWALEHVDPEEHPFLLFIDQTTALAPQGLSYLLEEMYRSNAGIVGPKLVAWDDASKLLSVGYGADRRGRRIDLIESDEFDQDQYAGVSDVFVIPTGAQLIRTDLFIALDGFDPVMGDDNEDLDICWRAHTVAARVIVVPLASARQTRPARSKSAQLNRYRERARHRLRTLAVTSSRWSFLRNMIGAVLGLVGVAVGNLLRGRPGYSRAAMGAIAWNLRTSGTARKRRSHLRSIRLVADNEIHALQSRIGPSVGSIVEQSLRPSAKLVGWTRSLRQSLADERQRIGSPVVVFLGMAILMIVLGTFELVGESAVVVGQNPVLGDGSDMISQWYNAVRPDGAGGTAAAPISFGILGVLSIALAWSPNMLYTVLLVGPLVLLAIGTFRMVRPLGGPRSAAVATAIAVANPLTADAFAAARWDTLVLWGAAPFLVVSGARLGDLAPWNTVPRSLPVRVLRFGLLTAVVSAFSPPFIPLAILAALSLGVFGVMTGRVFRIGHGLLGGLAAVVVPGVLHLPFSLDVLRGGGWNWVIGTHSAEESVASLSELVLFAPGRSTGSLFMWGLPVAASLGLLFGRSLRFDAAVLGWIMAIAGWGAAWAAIHWPDAALPGADIPLTLAAAGLTLGVGASVRAVQVDLKRYGYGWRQIATVVGAGGAVLVLLLGVGQSLGGRHDHPQLGYAEITSRLAIGPEGGTSRILWLGDPRVLPADTAISPSGAITYALTDGRGTDITSRFLPAPLPVTHEVGVLLDVVADGDSVRLGRLLSVFGIDYIIHQPQLAPAPYEGPSFEIDAKLRDALANQLDLRRQQATLNLIVFSNESSRGSAVLVDENFDAETNTLTGLLDTDLSTGTALVPEAVTATEIRFAPSPTLAEGDRILLALSGEGWESFGGIGPIQTTVGGTTLVTIEDPSRPFGVRHSQSRNILLGHLAQLFLVAAALLFSTRRSDRSLEPVVEDSSVLDLRRSALSASENELPASTTSRRSRRRQRALAGTATDAIPTAAETPFDGLAPFDATTPFDGAADFEDPTDPAPTDRTGL